MEKLKLSEAIEWADTNNLNSEWVKSQKKNIQNDWTNAIFLLRGVTDYINLYFNQGLDRNGSDFLFSITDQTAYNIFEEIKENPKKNTSEDRGIDAIILIADDGQLINSQEIVYKKIKDIIIFQAKNSCTPRSFEKEFKNAPNNLRDLLNELIVSSAEAITTLPGHLINQTIGMGIDRLKGATVTNVYITACAPSRNAIQKAPDWLKQLSGFPLEITMASEINVENKVLLTIDKLKKLIEEKKQNLRDTNLTHSVGSKPLNIASLDYQQFYSNKASAYQGFAYLKDYADFLKTKGDNPTFNEELINDNVRGEQGKGRAANKAIRRLLSTDSNNNFSKYIDFWWLNNGITIIAKGIKQISPNQITLKDPQIVNGQQTSRQIFDLKDNEFNPEWKIKISFIIIPSDDEISEEIKNKIIIGVNTQTPVTISNTLGLDNKIRKLSGYIKSESNDKILLSAKSEKNSDSDITYPYEFLIQMIVAAFYKKPGEARRGISSLVKSYFDLIFTDKNTENNTQIIESWINFINQVKSYDDFYKEKDWSVYGENQQKNFDLGDNYGYLGIFAFINGNINCIDKESNDFNILDLNKNNYKITEDKFKVALNKWHHFMNDKEKRADPDGYTKSTKFSIDIEKILKTEQTSLKKNI